MVYMNKLKIIFIIEFVVVIGYIPIAFYCDCGIRSFLLGSSSWISTILIAVGYSLSAVVGNHNPNFHQDSQ